MSGKHSAARLAGITLVLGCISLRSNAAAQENPPGGQPLPGAKQSVSDLEEQVAYQRAFEAVLWAIR